MIDDRRPRSSSASFQLLGSPEGRPPCSRSGRRNHFLLSTRSSLGFFSPFGQPAKSPRGLRPLEAHFCSSATPTSLPLTPSAGRSVGRPACLRRLRCGQTGWLGIKKALLSRKLSVSLEARTGSGVKQRWRKRRQLCSAGAPNESTQLARWPNGRRRATVVCLCGSSRG